jgi:hypothetical protein
LILLLLLLLSSAVLYSCGALLSSSFTCIQTTTYKSLTLTGLRVLI